MLFAMIIFAFSFCGIVALFALKQWETKRQRIVAPQARVHADQKAIEFKGFLSHLGVELQKLPPTLVRLSGIIVHELALGAAVFARYAERQSHRLADMVSHKHRFERREPRSEFLKQMTDHKNGNSSNPQE